MRNNSIIIFAVIVSAFYMTGCIKSESLDHNTEEVVCFSAGANSRAAIDGTTFEDGSQFSVWGWRKLIDGGTESVNVFDKTSVTNSTDGWTYDGVRYWIPGWTYDFYAVHPVFPADGPVASVASDGTISVTNFDCSKTGAEAKDLMTAQKNGITYTEGISPSPVDLKFSHELAKLNFVVKSENAVATITEFKVYGVDYMGTLSKKSTTATWSDKTTCQDTDTPFILIRSLFLTPQKDGEKMSLETYY